MKTLLVSLFVVVLAMDVSMAADDPMQSLFMFQQQMAEGGNAAAMMKLGEMYEKGEGTKRDLNKAREMYEQAKAKGYPKADAALSK
ncbi:MAG: SEL1-like repeat protein, partial [Halobacteria archaeon]|nr:SEL1-like repeat protein [Halobacteria archaeon]